MKRSLSLCVLALMSFAGAQQNPWRTPGLANLSKLDLYFWPGGVSDMEDQAEIYLKEAVQRGGVPVSFKSFEDDLVETAQAHKGPGAFAMLDLDIRQEYSSDRKHGFYAVTLSVVRGAKDIPAVVTVFSVSSYGTAAAKEFDAQTQKAARDLIDRFITLYKKAPQ
ncbi:hypothetical protein [Deinococcus multiflagellatus]|uniref:hypothetical protein n=1 Tax=Deinococcus multiflagellatus TaxID=1656887 RepID=UPI001CCC7119|nr:hypothetical protein [Deinococcus multiflagellatus]MBZ9713637.1 hypothetical protein [Deinococcus multiflagellatus]